MKHRNCELFPPSLNRQQGKEMSEVGPLTSGNMDSKSLASNGPRADLAARSPTYGERYHVVEATTVDPDKGPPYDGDAKYLS